MCFKQNKFTKYVKFDDIGTQNNLNISNFMPGTDSGRHFSDNNFDWYDSSVDAQLADECSTNITNYLT